MMIILLYFRRLPFVHFFLRYHWPSDLTHSRKCLSPPAKSKVETIDILDSLFSWKSLFNHFTLYPLSPSPNHPPPSNNSIVPFIEMCSSSSYCPSCPAYYFPRFPSFSVRKISSICRNIFRILFDYYYCHYLLPLPLSSLLSFGLMCLYYFFFLI